MIKINGKKYTGFWAEFWSWIITALTFAFMAAGFLLICLLLFSPFLILLGLGILIGKIF